MAIEFHKLTIADIRRETPEAVSIVFAVPPELKDDYRFSPGQHLTLRQDCDGQDIRRSYSICAGLDDGELRVAVKKVEGGIFSTLCNDTMKPGDMIDVMTPQGRFGLMPDPERRTELSRHRGRFRHHADPVTSAQHIDARAEQPLSH